MSKLFGHGDLRLWLLKLLDDKPRHGYDIISALEERFLGLYSPSPGTVYPRLSALEADGLIAVSREEEGRKVYTITDAGKAELATRADDLKAIGDRLSTAAKDISREIREDVKASVRDLRQQMRDAAREVRRDERMAARSARDATRRVREARAAAREVEGDLRKLLRTLRADLDGFVADVLTAARRRELSAARLASLRDALRDARTSVIQALDGDEREEDSA